MTVRCTTGPTTFYRVDQQDRGRGDAAWGGTKRFAAIAVFCNGGAGGVGFYDQEPGYRPRPGAFRLSPRVGDRLRPSISRIVEETRKPSLIDNLRTDVARPGPPPASDRGGLIRRGTDAVSAARSFLDDLRGHR